MQKKGTIQLERKRGKYVKLVNKRKFLSAFTVLALVVSICSTSPLYAEVITSSEGTLQPDLIPFSHAGSTQLSDGTFLILKLDWGNSLQVWKSVNDGETWTYVSTLPASEPLGFEKIFCTDKDTIIVATKTYQNYEGYIYRSTDEGATWAITYAFNADEGPPWNICEDSNGDIYMSIYSSGSSTSHAKLLRSANDGVSWQQIAHWPEYHHCHGMFVNSYNGYIYVCLHGFSLYAVMRSKDNGQTWTNLESRHLFTSINGKGDSNFVYLGTDNWNETKIYRFADDGSSSIDLQTVYDYGSNQSGNVYFLQAVNGKLVFGTSGSCINLNSGYHCILGVSDSSWNSFNVVDDYIADGPCQGYGTCTLSYWNISKVFVSHGTAFQPSSDSTPNHVPTVSVISGPISGYRNKEHTWTASGSDADGDALTYEWYLDDVLVSGGSSFNCIFDSGDALGSYLIKVRVQDALGDYSSYSTLTFTLNEATGLYYCSFNVTYDEDVYVVETCSNSSVTDLTFNQALKRMRFSVEGTGGSAGFCNVSIPAELLSGDFTVFMDDMQLVEGDDHTVASNSTHSTLNIAYEHSTHIIEIVGTTVIPDFAGWLFLPFLMLATLSALISKRYRKQEKD